MKTGTPHGVLDPMLPAHELARLCERLGLSVEAKVLIESIRSSPPTRRVRSAAGNVSVRYPSRKMGVTIQAESHHVELAALYEYEHDSRTLEFYDQPAPIKLVYAAKNGRRLGVWHTPDYFVLRSDCAGWEEWKPEAGLEQLVETMPNRYLRDATVRWRCPPGEHFAETLGLYYRLRSSAEIDWVLQRNLRFLADYLALESAPLHGQNTEIILKLVRDQPGLHLDELIGQLGTPSADDIFTLIASNRIFVDLRAAPLAEAERVRVFRDADIAQVSELVGMQEQASSRLTAQALGRLARASPADLREANRRYGILAPYLAGMRVVDTATPARTIRDWVARWRAAEVVDGCGFAGLLPRLNSSGNRLRKLPEPTLALMDHFLAADYETFKQKRKFAVYAALVRVCEQRGVVAPSYKTFTLAARHRPRQEQVAKRQGRGLAPRQRPFIGN